MDNIDERILATSGSASSMASYLKLLKDANEAMTDLSDKTAVKKATAERLKTESPKKADAKKKAKRKAAKKSRSINRHK